VIRLIEGIYPYKEMKPHPKFVMLSTISAILVFSGAATMMLTVQRVNAIGVPCSECAKDFAPGQEFQSDPKTDNAKSFAPGQEAKIPVFCAECAKDFAPGQQLKK
jgi:hypothetical protein